MYNIDNIVTIHHLSSEVISQDTHDISAALLWSVQNLLDVYAHGHYAHIDTHGAMACDEA